MQPNSHRLKHFFLLLLKLIISPKRPSDAALRSFDRILVIRQHDQLGDMLCVVPLLRRLRQRYPQAHIALMTSPVNHDVMLNNPYINQVIKYDKRDFLLKSFIRFGALWRFIRRLREEKFDLVIVPSTVSMSVTSDLFGYLCGAQYRIGAGEIDGVENPSGVFFNVPVMLDWRADPHRHQSLRNLEIAQPLGLHVTDLTSRIGLTAEEVERAKSFVAESGSAAPIIVFHPGAGKPPNRWPAERFARVADTLARELNASVLITHGPMDDGPVTEMKSHVTVSSQVVERKSLREVAAILSLARLVVSNDTGIMHVAAAVGTPVLSLFGPTDPGQWAPIGGRHRFIRGKDGEIGSISVEEVLAVAREMLQ